MNPTYHPIVVQWSCRHCQNRGEVHVHVNDTVDIRWQKVLDAHVAADSNCYSLHRGYGLVVRDESGNPPE